MPGYGKVIWDWNGTLQDDLVMVYENGVQAIFEHYGVPCPTLEEYRNEVIADWVRFYHDRGIPAAATKDDLNAIMRQKFDERVVHAPLFSDAAATVRELAVRGYDQAVVSGYDQALLDEAVKRSGFGYLLTSVEGNVRDKAGVFRNICGRTRAYFADVRIVAVGDVVDDALAAAATDNLQAYLCPRGFHSEDRIRRSGAVCTVIPTLADLLRFLPPLR